MGCCIVSVLALSKMSWFCLTRGFLVFLTTIPSIFEGVYRERVGLAGLNYIALGVGLTGASQINARLMDKIYIYFTKKNGGEGRPEYRLRECLQISTLIAYTLPEAAC